MIWLGIDTSNIPLSICIVKENEIITEENTTTAVNHSLRAMPAIEEAFARAKLLPKEIDGIVVAEGPGSYTGVRIGVTIAKTLAWTLNKPLIGVSSLASLATNVSYFDGYICPVIDARRNHVYAGIYNAHEGNLNIKMEDQHLSIEELIDYIDKLQAPVLFVGQDVRKFEEELLYHLQSKAIFAPFQYNIPKASSLIYASHQNPIEDHVHQFVPDYKRIAEAEANWMKANKKE